MNPVPTPTAAAAGRPRAADGRQLKIPSARPMAAGTAGHHRRPAVGTDRNRESPFPEEPAGRLQPVCWPGWSLVRFATDSRDGAPVATAAITGSSIFSVVTPKKK